MTGWECPRCHRVWAPFVQDCAKCNWHDAAKQVQDNSRVPAWLRPDGSTCTTQHPDYSTWPVHEPDR